MDGFSLVLGAVALSGFSFVFGLLQRRPADVARVPLRCAAPSEAIEWRRGGYSSFAEYVADTRQLIALCSEARDEAEAAGRVEGARIQAARVNFHREILSAHGVAV